jgi:hypothetical protein
MNRIVRTQEQDGDVLLRIPKDIAERLKLAPNGAVELAETGDRLVVSAVEERVAKQLEVGRRVAERNKEALARLAR